LSQFRGTEAFGFELRGNLNRRSAATDQREQTDCDPATHYNTRWFGRQARSADVIS
jgi:hypothetical protein